MTEMVETRQREERSLGSFTFDVEDYERDVLEKLVLPSNTRDDRLLVHEGLLSDNPRSSTRSQEWEGYWEVPITLIDKAPWVDKNIFEDYPLSSGMAEATWATNKLKEDGVNGVVYMIGDITVVRGKFSYPLHDMILKELSQGEIDPVYNRKHEFWVGGTEVVLDSESLVEDYGYELSPDYRNLIEGLGSWGDIMGIRAEIARSNGYQVPTMFDTDRNPYPWQEEAIVHLANNGRTLLADQVGLGKGGSFIGGFLSQVEKRINDGAKEEDQWPLLIVTNNSLKDNIAKEFTDWHKEGSVFMLEGTKSSPIPDGYNAIVTNVNILDKRKEDIMAAKPKGMIIDESQSMKSSTSKMYKAALAISKDMARRVPLEDQYIVLASATPLVNRPAELFSQLEILGYGRWYGNLCRKFIPDNFTKKVRTARGWYAESKVSDRTAFEYYFCEGHTNRFGQWDAKGSAHAAELNSTLVNKVGMVRRRKEDVMHPMPECHESFFGASLTAQGRELYQEVAQKFRDWSTQMVRSKTTRDVGFEELSKKRQKELVHSAIREHEDNLDAAEVIMQITKLREVLGKIKIPTIIDFIHDFMEEGSSITNGDDSRRKLIVFAEHHEVLDTLCNDPDLQEYGLLSLRSGDKRQDEVVSEFQSNPDKRLIICYFGAKEGHTMTAAKDVMIAELPQGYAPIVQMAGRCFARVSENFPPHEAYVHFPVVPGSYEETIFQSNQIKKAYSDIIIDGADEEDYAEVLEDKNSTLADIISMQLKASSSMVEGQD